MSAIVTGPAISSRRGLMNSEIRLVREYAHSRAKVWRALTDPSLMALWGMRPEGFAPVAGTRFRLVGKPNRGWRGYVECEVSEASEPEVLAYSWVDAEGASTRQIRYSLQQMPGGTRLIFEHCGFIGIGGFLLNKLIMLPGFRKTVGRNIPQVLAAMREDGTLRPGSALAPRF
jgi:uncharacterized protein YndB with AHSA1/START domain